jgi:DNA-binding LacI/PurR family transcriptional regulator
MVLEGLLFVGGSPAGEPNMLRSALADGVPVVTIGWHLPDNPFDLVDADKRDAGYQATEHLVATVRSRSAEIMGPAGWRESDERDRGYDAVHAAAGRRAVPRRKVGTVSWSEAVHGYTVIEEILHRRVRFDGLVAPNDTLALEAMQALRAHGLHAPDDVGVVSVDDQLARRADPPLTSIRQTALQVGAQATRRLLERLTDPGRSGQMIELKTTLIARESSWSPTKEVGSIDWRFPAATSA